MSECDMRHCTREAKFIAKWTRNSPTKSSGVVEEKRVCVFHAGAEAPDPPQSVEHFPEDLNAERKRVTEFAKTQKQALKEAAFPGSAHWR